MDKIYLINCIYENSKQRVVLYFSKDPYNKKNDFVYTEKFNPFLYVDLSKEILAKILSDFKKEIIITEENKVTKIIAKDKETLYKCYKLILLTTSKKIILLNPERQYLIKKKWSYYDLFLIISRKEIKKVETNNLNYIVRKYINPFLKEEQITLIENLTKKILLENILKTRIKKITLSEIMNTLFENLFFENKLCLKNDSKTEYKVSYKKHKDNFEINFSNIWPYFLTQKFYNVGYDTLNCNCCMPKNHLETNTLSTSLLKVSFKKDGFYFISKDKDWAYKYHINNELKENRLNFRKKNYLKEIPIGPFFKNNIKEIPLIDAIYLLKEDSIQILDSKNINWYCLKKESFISKTIQELLERLKNIEKSINLSTTMIYNKSFNQMNSFEKNPLFIQYFTEYKLINDIVEEIPNFIEHKNTKFYSEKLSKTIKYIKYETIQKIDEDKKYIIDKEKIIFKEKSIFKKINTYFPKINLPIPKLILNN